MNARKFAAPGVFSLRRYAQTIARLRGDKGGQRHFEAMRREFDDPFPAIALPRMKTPTSDSRSSNACTTSRS